MLHNLDEWLARYESGQLDRRAFLAGVATMAGAATIAAQPARAGLAVTGLHHVELKTLDLNRSRDFYAGLLGVRPEVRADRVVLPLGSGEGRGYVSITTGPIERVDHFSVKVSGMHPRDPKATLGRLTSLGYKARQLENRIYVTDPDGKEIELQGASTRA